MAQITEPNKSRPEYYWNNAYNPHLVRYWMHKEKNKMWYRSLEVQEEVAEIDPIFGDFSSFKIDNAFNKEYGLKPYSLTHCIKQDIFPYYNKQSFMRKYRYGEPIDLIDILSDDNIFTKRILFFIDSYLLMNIKFIALPIGTVVCIETGENGISLDLYKKIRATAKFCIVFTGKSDFFNIQTKREFLFNDNYIMLNKAKIAHESTKRPDMANYFHVYISAIADEPNMLMGTYGHLVKDPVMGDVIEISPEYRQYIADNTLYTANVWIFNEYNQKGVMLYNKDVEGDDLLLLDRGPNLIAPGNIFVYEYNPELNLLGTRVNIDRSAVYPEATLFNGFEVGNSYLIEWHEEPVETDISVFDNPWDIYFKVHPEMYVDKVDEFKYYKFMKEFIYDYDDYKVHPFNGDLRGYEINKLISLLRDNPYLHQDYIRMQHDMVRVARTSTMTPECVKEVVIPRLVEDTYFAAGVEELTLYFDIPMNYVKYDNSANYKKHTELFIDGKRTYSKWNETNGHASHIFIKPEDISEGDEITLVICRYPADDKTEVYTQWYERHVPIDFPNNDAFEVVSIGNILCWDKVTGEYIPPSDLQYIIKQDKDVVDNPFVNDEVQIGITNKSYLLTQNIEYYATMYRENILLAKETIDVENPDEESYQSTKREVNANRLQFSVESEKWILREIGVTNTNTSHIGRIVDCSDVKDDHKIIFHGFKEDPSPTRFRAYHNGLLLDESEYVYTAPLVYGGDAVFDFGNFTEGEIILDYLPYVEDKVYSGPIVDINKITDNDRLSNDKMNNLILVDIGEYCKYCVTASMVKVYIDGRIIDPKRIYDTKALNYVLIDLQHEQYTDASKITIFIDWIDKDDIFQYEELETIDVNRKFIISESTQYRYEFVVNALKREPVNFGPGIKLETDENIEPDNDQSNEEATSNTEGENVNGII